jgi:hypothetical protein
VNDDLCCSIHSLVGDGKDGAAGANILTDIQLRLLQQTQELVGAQNFGALLQKPRFTALCEIALALSSSSSWLQLADQTFCFLSVSLAMGGGDKKGEDDQRDLYIQLYLALVHALELASADPLLIKIAENLLKGTYCCGGHVGISQAIQFTTRTPRLDLPADSSALHTNLRFAIGDHVYCYVGKLLWSRGIVIDHNYFNGARDDQDDVTIHPYQICVTDTASGQEKFNLIYSRVDSDDFIRRFSEEPLTEAQRMLLAQVQAYQDSKPVEWLKIIEKHEELIDLARHVTLLMLPFAWWKQVNETIYTLLMRAYTVLEQPAMIEELRNKQMINFAIAMKILRRPLDIPLG